MREKSQKLVSDFLKRHPKDKHILIAAANDTSALGAMDGGARAAAREACGDRGAGLHRGGDGGDAAAGQSR